MSNEILKEGMELVNTINIQIHSSAFTKCKENQ